MLSPLVILAAQAGTQSEPPSATAIFVWLAMFLVFLWGLLHGWLADATHSMWAGTWILPGVMSDIPTLRRIYRWFGIFVLLLILALSIAAHVERHTVAPSTI